MPGRAETSATHGSARSQASRKAPLLTVSGLSRSFGAVPVLTGVDLRVDRTLRQLSSSPGLRAQFAPRDRSPVPTPFGDLPLDLWRQVLRGPLLLTMLIVVVVVVLSQKKPYDRSWRNAT